MRFPISTPRVRWTYFFASALLVLAAACSHDSSAASEAARESGLASTQASLSAACADCSYAVDGTWMYDQTRSSWVDSLGAFKGIGGDTILRWGYGLTNVSEATLESWLAQIGCSAGVGQSCVQQAKADLAAARVNVRRWLYFGDPYAAGAGHKWRHYSDAVLCKDASSLDRKIVAGNMVVQRILLPTATGQNACNHKSGTFDVLFTWYDASQEDMEEFMLELSAEQGIDVYLGAPRIFTDATNAPPTREWSRRVFDDYKLRYADLSSFKGIYQSSETPLAYQEPRSGGPVITEYRVHIADFHNRLPDKQVVASPYFKLNRETQSTPASTAETFKTFVRETGIDVVAPQDGRGVGKSALYFPYQADSVISSVDPALALYDPAPSTISVDGTQSFAHEFAGSTKEVFDALKAARDELAAEDPAINVALWANLEAFENPADHDSSHACNWRTDRAQTTKSRLDWAITMAGSQGDKVVAFEWSPFFLCKEAGSALLEEIWADHARPIVTDMRPSVLFDQDGFSLLGHNLDLPGNEIQLAWWETDANGEWSSHIGWFTPRSVGTLPNGQVRVWIPFDQTVLAPHFWVHARAFLAGRTVGSSHSYSWGY